MKVVGLRRPSSRVERVGHDAEGLKGPRREEKKKPGVWSVTGQGNLPRLAVDDGDMRRLVWDRDLAPAAVPRRACMKEVHVCKEMGFVSVGIGDRWHTLRTVMCMYVCGDGDG